MLFKDINECIDLGFELECLKKNSECLNTIGSYECRCLDGFYSDPTTKLCIDINECASAITPCANNAICLNSVGSFSCQCNSGYTWSTAKKICVDIDECAASNINTEIRVNEFSKKIFYTENLCDDHSVCVNTIGSYVCSCKQGWRNINTNYCSGKIFYLYIVLAKPKLVIGYVVQK